MDKLEQPKQLGTKKPEEHMNNLMETYTGAASSTASLLGEAFFSPFTAFFNFI